MKTRQPESKAKHTVMMTTGSFRAPLEPMGTRLEKQTSKLSSEYQENVPATATIEGLGIMKKMSQVSEDVGEENIIAGIQTLKEPREGPSSANPYQRKYR